MPNRSCQCGCRAGTGHCRGGDRRNRAAPCAHGRSARRQQFGIESVARSLSGPRPAMPTLSSCIDAVLVTPSTPGNLHQWVVGKWRANGRCCAPPGRSSSRFSERRNCAVCTVVAPESGLRFQQFGGVFQMRGQPGSFSMPGDGFDDDRHAVLRWRGAPGMERCQRLDQSQTLAASPSEAATRSGCRPS
jgi:hypothetical protein